MLEAVRAGIGQILFGKIWTPPSPDSPRVKIFEGDYGNGFLYEELFAGNGMDLVAAKKICQHCDGEVLDAGGGTGRLSAFLAEQGVKVTLFDRSQFMLSQAQKKRGKLMPLAQDSFSIVEGELSQCRLNKKFDVIFAVNSVLEHFSDENQTLEALKALSRHLTPKGKFYLDVHHAPTLENDPKWKSGRWRYNFDRRIRGARFRVWQRTLAAESKEKVVCEQAFTTNFRQYTLSRTIINVFDMERWLELFRRAGFEVFNVWGNWALEPISNHLPKIVVKLGLHN